MQKLGLLLRNKSEQTNKAYLICIEKFLQFAGLVDKKVFQIQPFLSSWRD